MAGRVLIVGAGIVGLSTAYWLKKRGLEVTVVERGPIPCPTASSSDHHRLIRYVYGDDAGYCARMVEGYAAWREMWADLREDPAYYYQATGMLAASQEQGDYTDRSRVAMEGLGLPFERVEGGALAERFPFLEADAFSYALVSEGGALMANRILTDLAQWLREAGAEILEFSPVTKVDAAGGQVQLSDGRALSADLVVVSAGVATAQLVPDLAANLTPVRSLIVYAEPPRDLRAAWAGAPCWTDLGGATDLWGMSPVDALPLKLGNGAMGSSDPAPDNRSISPAEVAELMASYRGYFRGIDDFRVRWGAANYWTQTPQSQFQLIQRDRALIAAACAGHGFKFGALSGRDVARAAAGEAPVAEVAAQMAARG